MKIREKRKFKEKESKEIGKYRWSAIWTSITCVFLAIGCNWLYKEFLEHPEWAQWIGKLMKFCYYTVIIGGILCLIGGIYFIFFNYPKLCQELKELKDKEKQLEQEIANQ